MSCKNPVAYKYDANGAKRWCVDCGAPLNDEQSWHPHGSEAPGWVVALIVFGLPAVVLTVIILVSAMPYQ